MEAVTKPLLRNLIVSGQLGPIPTCIILDGLFSFIVDFNAELKIPIFCFRTISASSFWAYSSILQLIRDGQLPVRGEEDMDRIIQGVDGLENVLRCRDLPGFSRVGNKLDQILEYCVTQTIQSCKAQSLILNTFEDLEGSIMSWLDSQPSKSVVYVSFGSVTALGDDQFREFWHGLVDSGRRFLWVVRPNLVAGKYGENGIPAELEEGTIERGLMVGWAPQEEVLRHEAIGGFLSHCGWNSTLESLVAGVPMICWPQFADQLTNRRCVSEVWKIGVDMKDFCDRETVAKMVNDVIEFRRDKLMGSVIQTTNLAVQSVEKGGSSFCNFERMVHDIRFLSSRNQ